ncbi:MAG: (2E,6E)-farnesyl diphosphate synthase [Gammaproteobacteria bacterium]|nr:(2E,6E)-farnesyl diphosphate synthase [Gammaproteobacteria bacterium]
MSLQEKLSGYQARVESALDHWLPSPDTAPKNLHEAMRYAVMGEGKRIRPVLVYATGETFGVELTALDAPAVAVELIHAYSLVHDDLPAMDDDDLRRGKPTCHKAFDEATAILAGDAIQALSFYALAADSNSSVSSNVRIKMIVNLAQNSGSPGMAGGQAIDLAAVGKKLNLKELEIMHNRKTGALIRSSVELGALSSPDISNNDFEMVSTYAENIGLAFQVRDDILDIESDTSTLGKPQGSDAERGKPTYPELLGLDGAKQVAEELHEKAIHALKRLDRDTTILKDIADYIVGRKN